MQFQRGWCGLAISLLVFGCGGGSGGAPPLVDGGGTGTLDAGGPGAGDGAADANDDDAFVLPPLIPLPALPAYRGRIVVTPAAVLFTKLGDHTVLRAQVFDASGQPLAATDFTWESSRAGMVAVDAQGQVTATAALGSAQIRVRAGGLVSPPVMVIVAEPAPGAVLVSDAQIVAGPTPMDPAVATDVGSKVTLSVTGVAALAPGTVLLASEGKSVAGKVVSATPVAGQDRQDVVLELIPMLDLFKRLNVDGSYDIDPAAMAEVLATTPQLLPLRAEPPVAPVTRGLQLGEVMIGPFKCEAKIVGGAISGSGGVDLRPNFTFNHRFIKDEDTGDWTELMAKLEGSLTVTGSVGLTFAPGFVGTASCEAILAKIPVPVAGALSALIRFEIPLSIEGEISGSVSLFTLKGALELKGESKITLGFHYTPQTGTRDLGKYDNKNELKPTFTLPGGELPNATATLGVAVGGGAGLNISALLGSLSLLKASLMLKAELKAGPIRNGLMFTGAYDLKPVLEAGAGSDVKKAMRWFGGLVSVDSSISTTFPVIAQSPRGKFTADKMTVRPMQPVKLTVELDPMTLDFFGFHNVVDVRIYRPHRTDVGFELVDTISGAPGKTSYSHTFMPDYLDAAAGVVSFWAGVSTRLLPGLALEVNEMSKLDVKVSQGASRWKGTVTVTCSKMRIDQQSGDTFSESTTATVDLEHLTEADALMANAKVTGTGMYIEKNTHDFMGGSTDCPFTAHEELNTKCMEFQPLVFQTRFDDTSGSYALLGVANLAGTRQFTHTETSTCKPPFTRTDPPTPYTSSVGYMIDGKVEPDAPSFSGSKFTEDVGERCDWTWNFSRL